MSILDKIVIGAKHDNLPEECRIYFNYVKKYLSGFSFEDDISYSALYLLRCEYDYYHKFKTERDFDTATSKYDHYTFLKDFMRLHSNYDCARALAILLIYSILRDRYTRDSFGYATLKDAMIQLIKKMDREKVPESFFCYYGADEIPEEVNYLKKCLALSEENLKLRAIISDYEDNQK